MSSILILAVFLECLLILMTAVLIVQPQAIFRTASPRIQSIAFGAGMVSLCLTFCWSVVLGILLNLNGITIKI